MFSPGLWGHLSYISPAFFFILHLHSPRFLHPFPLSSAVCDCDGVGGCEVRAQPVEQNEEAALHRNGSCYPSNKLSLSKKGTFGGLGGQGSDTPSQLSYRFQTHWSLYCEYSPVHMHLPNIFVNCWLTLTLHVENECFFSHHCPWFAGILV